MANLLFIRDFLPNSKNDYRVFQIDWNSLSLRLKKECNLNYLPAVFRIHVTRFSHNAKTTMRFKKEFSIRSLIVLTFVASVILALGIPFFESRPRSHDPHQAVWKDAKREIETRGDFKPYRNGAMFRKCDGNWYVMARPQETMLVNWGVFLEINESGQVLRYEKGAVEKLFFSNEKGQ